MNHALAVGLGLQIAFLAAPVQAQIIEGEPGPLEFQLNAADAESLDSFGGAVQFPGHLDIQGDTAIIGAPHDSDQGTWSGSAYVFQRKAGHWVQTQKLLAAGGQEDDRFGFSVVLDGQVAAISAAFERIGAIDAVGTVRMFRRHGSLWIEEQKLNPVGQTQAAFFGASLDLQGNRLVVGAPRQTGAQFHTGLVTTYEYDGTQWQELGTLGPTTPTLASESFGFSVALDGDRLAVGSPTHSTGTLTIVGLVDVYQWNGAGWDLVQEFGKGPPALHGDRFGYAIDLCGDDMIIGSPTSGGLSQAIGQAFMFHLGSTGWEQEVELFEANPQPGDRFGYAVTLQGTRALVGASTAMSISVLSGSTYVYERLGGEWKLVRALWPSADSDDKVFGFGNTLALDGSLALVGAPETFTAAGKTGRAHIFELDWSDLGTGLSSPASSPLLSPTGTIASGQPLGLSLDGALPNSTVWLVLGSSVLVTPFKGGQLVPVPELLLPVNTDANGTFDLDSSWPFLPLPVQIDIQAWFPDASAVAGFAASNAVEGHSG